MKVFMEFEPDSRYLIVQFEGENPLAVLASNETSNPLLRRDSTTWRFEQPGLRYRVQVQVTEVE